MDALKVFKALSDGTRLGIVEMLLDGERCVCEIVPKTGRTQSTVSIQLDKLERAGILKSRRDGKRIYYSINDPRIAGLMKMLKEKAK